MKRANSEDDIELLNRDDPMQRMPFLGGKYSSRTVGSRFFNYGRHFRRIGFFIAILAAAAFIIDTWGDAFLEFLHSNFDDALTGMKDTGQELHVLLSAAHSDTSLCKTTLGLNIMGYPGPTLIGWDKKQSKESISASHKISTSLSFIRNMDEKDDIVMLADGYDTWFQLPPDVLRKRYFNAMSVANYRMRVRLGRRAVRRESMKQTVLFGVMKKCTPQNRESISCYPIPEPPIYPDMYGNNTDTKNGHEEYSSFRPRYPDAGYIMGPARNIEKILVRAEEVLKEGSGTQYPDAQHVFARVFGEQAFQREVIRKRYRSWFKKWSPPHTPGSFEEKKYKDIIHPPFRHEKMEEMSDHPREYGISLDYGNQLGVSVAYAKRDISSVTFDQKSEEDFNAQISGDDLDCKTTLKHSLPHDISLSELPPILDEPNGSWDKKRLFVNICTGKVPVLLHMDGDEQLKAQWWPDMWFQPKAEKLLEKLQKNVKPHDTLEKQPFNSAGAWSDKGDWIEWSHMCPREFNDELFGSRGAIG